MKFGNVNILFWSDHYYGLLPRVSVWTELTKHWVNRVVSRRRCVRFTWLVFAVQFSRKVK